jgi:hypothetical protein
MRRTAVTDNSVSANDNIEQASSNADVIVTSLRASAEWIKDVEHESWFGTADLQTDAADEIERLRTEVQEVWAVADVLATRLETISSGNANVLREYDLRREEANRG